MRKERHPIQRPGQCKYIEAERRCDAVPSSDVECVWTNRRRARIAALSRYSGSMLHQPPGEAEARGANRRNRPECVELKRCCVHCFVPALNEGNQSGLPPLAAGSISRFQESWPSAAAGGAVSFGLKRQS
jgi:hypothetical protein